jgi:serine/threonine protein kinase
MTPQEFAKVREIFHKGCELPRAERRGFIDENCAGSPSLRDAVEAFFAADETAERTGDKTGTELAGQLLRTKVTETALPQDIGPYRILSVLGHGGMGIAYLAQQSKPDRQVALKVLRSGVQSSSLRVRFAREIRVLGRLVHPGIARIYESGTAEGGNGPISYYAMEYVSGPNLLDYAKEHALDLAARLELVARIADAVQHAHTKSVVHRDLKPANILVRGVSPAKEASRHGTTSTSQLTAGPQPVILDFGVARMLDGDGDATQLTEAGLLIGTVGYMSVEQLSGDIDAIDARADVYSMGVILYELLTGRMPHDLRGKPVPEAARIVRDEEPAPLNSNLNTVPGSYDRDIATIVSHAMAKNREHRYQTAASLAEDLRRYLNHEPILARPATTLYQLSKFARRHRGLVGSALATLVMLAAGLGVSLAMYAKAEEQRRQADQERQTAIQQRQRADHTEKMSTAVRNYLLDDVLMAVSPERLGTSATLVDVMLNARQEIGTRFVGQPEVEAEVRMTLASVLVSAGREKEGAEEWAAAVALLEGALGPDHEKTIDAVLRQADARNGPMVVKERIRLTEDAVERIKRVHPENHLLLIRAMDQAGRQNIGRFYFGLANKYFREAYELAEATPGLEPGVSVSLLSQMIVCAQKVKNADPAEALRLHTLVTERARSLDPADPANFRILTNLMRSSLQIGRDGDAVALADRLSEMVAEHINASDRGPSYRSISQTYHATGNHEKAAKYGLLATESYTVAFPNATDAHRQLAIYMCKVYAAWPDHAREYQEWTIQALRYRLMLVFSDIEKGTPGRKDAVGLTRNFAVQVEQIQQATKALGEDITLGAALDKVWARRDEFAPVAHGRRAMFLINLASAGRQIKHLDHVDEAIALATAALPHSVNLSVAEAALAQLKADLTGQHAPVEPSPVEPAPAVPDESAPPK